MRRKIFMALVVIATFFTTVYAGTPITIDRLPKEARAFITKYFPKDNVKKMEQEKGRRGMEYEVTFTNGAEVDFREDGTWKDVKAAKGHAVPSAIVPQAISKYVKANHSGQAITEISRKRGGYEVELSNGIELKLSEDAKPITGQGHGKRGR